ncbi:MAG: dipeptide epimerase [Halobacteriaceae archaeon]
MGLETGFERHTLPLEFPFTIARGTAERATVVSVRVGDGEHVGVGAAGPSSHYGETPDTVEAVLPSLLSVVEDVGDPHALARIERRLAATVRGNPAARCAVSIACHDLAAKRAGLPLYAMWGEDPAAAVRTSYTVGIDDAATMREKAAVAVERGHEVLKVKVGTGDDHANLAAVREAAPDATVRVDANEAWTPREAVSSIRELTASFDLEFVEQPVPAENPGGLGFVRDRVDVPVAADESCVTPDDVPRIADQVDVANLKLMKCGGLRPARRLIHAARVHGLEVMCGCMLESNASIAAACHLAPLLDYADLDGSLLLEADPYEGVPMDGGRIDLASLDRPGTGARPTDEG